MQSIAESTVTIEKDGVAIPLSPSRVAKMPRVPSSAELAVGLHITIGQPESDKQNDRAESNPSPTDPNVSGLAEYTIDQIVEHCGTKDQTEYKVRWYE